MDFPTQIRVRLREVEVGTFLEDPNRPDLVCLPGDLSSAGREALDMRPGQHVVVDFRLVLEADPVLAR